MFRILKSTGIKSLKMKSLLWGISPKEFTLKALICTAVIYLLFSSSALLIPSPFSQLARPLSCIMPDSNSSSAELPDRPIPRPNRSTPPIFSIPVQNLLDDLQQLRKTADAATEASTYNQQEEEAWARKNPCRARSELPPLYAGRKVVDDAPHNPEWDAVFEEYSHLHRTCMRNVIDIADVFETQRIIPGCKFLTSESLFGLGNRITYSASVLLYAVLTKRVVLFPEGTVPSIMCEPFHGSQWTLPAQLEYLNRRKAESWINIEGHSNVTVKFLGWMDEAEGNLDSAAATRREVFFHAEADDGWQPVDRFFCEAEQRFLANSEWISAAGCLYFLPKLYAIPTFRTTLDALFPAPGLTLAYVLRSAFLPNDEAWDRIQRIYEMHLASADRRVSIQARYRWGQEQHEQLGIPVNAHISQCLQENGLLPNVTESFTGRVGDPPFPIVKVMITSLYMDLHEHLSEIYLRHSSVSGESVGLLQLTHDKEQRSGKEVDIQALVEVICLSLSDAILVTPLSTFGGVAQAYGALKPWIIQFDDHEDGSCSRSPSVDMCYQEVHEMLTCPYDPSVDNSSAVDAVAYIEKCSALETSKGILLV